MLFRQRICFISMCVPWELNPQTLTLLTQCSTTIHRNVLRIDIELTSFTKNYFVLWIFFVFCAALVCTITIVKCSWDGLLEGRNCACAWPFWCSELCSVDQTVTVQRGSVLYVRGPEWIFQPFCSLWINTVLGEWGRLYQWLAQQSGLLSVVFWGPIW